jgi:cation diffusion facilitator family transporter
MTREEKLKKGQKVAGIAVWLEGALVAAKAMIGLLSGSLVLISDAIHSGSDILSIITSWFGLKIAQRKADQRFPYGYYKAENLGTLIISTLIIYAFWEMLNQGYRRLFSLSLIKMPLLALGVSFFDALILFFFGNYEVKVGKQIGAQSLVTMGKENKTHLFSSTAVFIGTAAAYYRIPYIEGVMTIGISLLILKIGLSAAKDSVLALMDVSPSQETEQKVIKAIESVAGIEEFFDLRLRKSGPFIFGETKVGIRKSIDVKRAHEIADNIEQEIKKKVPQIDSFTIHVEPFKSGFHHLVIPVIGKQELNSRVSAKFARAPYFLFVNLKGKKIKGYYFLKNPYQSRPVRAGLASTKLLVQQKSDTLITQQIGEISFYALRNNLFDIYQTKAKTAQEAIRRFNKEKLKPLQEASRRK